MPVIDAKAIPQVAMDFMNNDHEEAVTLLNQLFSALDGEENTAITQCLEGFIKHNQEHFAREEEEMLRISFPPYSCHKGEHDRVLAELHEVITQWSAEADREKLMVYLTDTVVPWFTNHIQTMDTVTAMFISRQPG